MNTYTESDLAKTQEEWLQEAERAKKKMYLKACLQHRWHFSPFVASVDGLLGVKSIATLKRMPSCIAKKWRQPYSRTCVYVNIRTATNLVRTTQRCIRGPGCWCTRSASSARSSNPAPGSTFSGKRPKRSPDQEKPPPWPNPNIYWGWRPKLTQQSKWEHQQAAGCKYMNG